MSTIKTHKERMWDEFEALQREVYSQLICDDDSFFLAEDIDRRFESLKMLIGDVVDAK